jgi:hypothetical protein
VTSLLDQIIADLAAAGLAASKTWGAAPLYVERGHNKPAHVYRTPGTALNLAAAEAALPAALAVLRAAGRTASIRAERITVYA